MEASETMRFLFDKRAYPKRVFVQIFDPIRIMPLDWSSGFHREKLQ